MAFGISVQTSVEAANSWRDWESCSIVGGSLETRSARTADSEEPRCRFMTRRHDSLVGHYLFARNFGEDFRDLLRKPNKAAAGFRQNRFSARFRVPSFRGLPASNADSCSDFRTTLYISRMHSELPAISSTR